MAPEQQAAEGLSLEIQPVVTGTIVETTNTSETSIRWGSVIELDFNVWISIV